MNRSVPSPDELIAVVRDYEQITDVFRLMKERLGLTNGFCDDTLGLTSGHTDKILGRSGTKRWGHTTLHAFMELFGIEFRVYVDLAAVKRMEQVWEGRERPLFKEAKVGQISQKIMAAAKPIVLSENARLGGLVTAHMRTSEQRSEFARKAAKIRWKRAKQKSRLAKLDCNSKSA